MNILLNRGLAFLIGKYNVAMNVSALHNLEAVSSKYK